MVLNGSYSSYSTVQSGVPQGSVLGPLLFLIYINDLERNIKSNIKFFVDDTMLYSIVKDPAISANNLNHDLDIIQQWAYQWKMEFNPDPTKQATEVLFSCKKSSPNHPRLIFNGKAVAKVNDQKHLGLILDSRLSFEKHINEKIMKSKNFEIQIIVFSLIQFHHGISLLSILMASLLLTFLKNISILFFVLRPILSSVYTFPWVSIISFN